MGRTDRLFALGNLLAGRRRWTLGELTETLEALPRTIYRDLAALEERGVAIERVNGTYRLMEGSTLRPLALTDRERLILGIALEAPAIVRHEAFRTEAVQLRAKLSAAGAQSDPSRSHVAASGPDRSGPIDREIVEMLESAVRSQTSVSILYTSLSSGVTEWRGLDPWLIAHRSEAWYVLGRCQVHDEPRTFRLDRVRNVLAIGSSFERPSDSEVRALLERRWGIFEGDPLTECVIEFEARLAPFIESAVHHSSEVKKRIAGGRLQYRVRVTHLGELARWIVSFGGEARAVEPKELIAEVREIAGGVLGAHRGDAKTKAKLAARRASLPRRR